MPSWSVEKVLRLLQTPKYSSDSCDLFNLLKKALFLTALATGNRVSEIGAMWLPLRAENSQLRIPVKPGFLYKNQRVGRSPPDIIIKSLPENRSLCPVTALNLYIGRDRRSSGPLFVNSKSKRPIKAPSVSSIICNLIEEADPGQMPKAHDLRKKAASLAWARGLKVQEITNRAFWSSSDVFISRQMYQ